MPLGDRLRLGCLLTTPEAMVLIPIHDHQRIATLAPWGPALRAPDRLLMALHATATATPSAGLRHISPPGCCCGPGGLLLIRAAASTTGSCLTAARLAHCGRIACYGL